MLAVLDDAIACFQKYIFARDRKGKTLFREAEEWILEENSDWPFSFETICEVLGFNPDYVRTGLMRRKEAQLAERPKAKIYRLTPKEKRKEPSVMTPERTEQRLRKASGVRLQRILKS